MKAPASLRDLAFLLQAGQHAVEIVLLDAHPRGQLRDRDARLCGDERQGLGSAGAAALATPGMATGCGRSSSGGGGRCEAPCGGCPTSPRPARTARPTADWRSARTRGRPTDARQCRGGGLQSVVLVDEWLELDQPVVYLSALLVKKISHRSIPSRGVFPGSLAAYTPMIGESPLGEGDPRLRVTTTRVTVAGSYVVLAPFSGAKDATRERCGSTAR
jgi:hypothetical protein